MALFFDVLLNDFVRDVAAADTKVAACPHVSPPELLPQMWKLVHQLVGTLPLQHLDEPTDGQAWRHAHEQMNVVARYMTFHYRDFVRTADFADQLSNSGADFAAHDWLTIFCDPDDVQMDAKDRMCAVPIFCHAAQSSTGLKTC